MPNKHYCQGPNCHTRKTKDRWQKSTGKLRGRYASWTIDTKRGYYDYMTLFCSQGCANEWLSDHADNIANRRPIPFITERRVAEGTYDNISLILSLNISFLINAIIENLVR